MFADYLRFPKHTLNWAAVFLSKFNACISKIKCYVLKFALFNEKYMYIITEPVFDLLASFDLGWSIVLVWAAGEKELSSRGVGRR